MNNEAMKEAIRVAIEALNILWVSHHANRGEAAIEGLELLQAALSQQPAQPEPICEACNKAKSDLSEFAKVAKASGLNVPASWEFCAAQQPAKHWWLRNPIKITAEHHEIVRGATCFSNDGTERDWSELEAAQQPAQPTVKESLTVQAQPSCGQAPYMWAISGSNARAWATNEIAKANLRNPDLDVIPLYTVQPDYEALRAKNDRLKADIDRLKKRFAYECWSNDDGDCWSDDPANCEFVDGLKVGDTFELLAGWNSVRVNYIVTKAPDDVSEDYEVEESK